MMGSALTITVTATGGRFFLFRNAAGKFVPRSSPPPPDGAALGELEFGGLITRSGRQRKATGWGAHRGGLPSPELQ